jgi:hypothetical protein
MNHTDTNADSHKEPTDAIDTTFDTIDDISDSNDVDVELTDTLETISNTNNTIDTIDTLSSVNDTDPAEDVRAGSPFVSEDLYEFVKKRMTNLDPFSTMALGQLTYHTDFHPHYTPPDKEGGFGKTLYKRSPLADGVEGEELGLVFFGEVCSSIYGTAISAKGNHYAGTAENPKVRNIQFWCSL